MSPEFVLVRVYAPHNTCRFCGTVCEFYTVGHTDPPDQAYGHEPIPFMSDAAMGGPDNWLVITEAQARKHVDWALARRLSTNPEVLVALGYAERVTLTTERHAELFANEEQYPVMMSQRVYVFTEAGAAIAGAMAGELAI